MINQWVEISSIVLFHDQVFFGNDIPALINTLESEGFESSIRIRVSFEERVHNYDRSSLDVFSNHKIVNGSKGIC